MTTADALSSLRAKYREAENLVEEESKKDPPTEPFRSHYSARDILYELLANIRNLVVSLEAENGSAEDLQTFKFLSWYVKIDIGKISMFVEEFSTAEKLLQEVIEAMEEHKMNPTIVCAYVNGLNHIGILWSNRGETEKAKSYLDKAEEIFDQFNRTGEKPLTIFDLFEQQAVGDNEKGGRLLEKMNTLTLFYQAQVYGALGDLNKSAVYCHTTLKKQLLMNDYEPIDWALNAATLSQYFCTNSRYNEARHHLAAATQILEEYEKVMLKEGFTDDEKKAAEEKFNHRSADVARCWIKYALNLMTDSKDRLMDDRDILDTPIQTPLKFDSQIDVAYEEVITDQYLLDMDDAKPVFLMLQKWIEKAKEYYKPEIEATEYSKIVQDNANAYKYLSFFESNASNQAKMHKRRIDLLEGLVELLNKLFYLNIVRECLYELGSAYSNLLDVKLDALGSGEPNPHALKKINDLCKKTIDNFVEYIQTYYEKNTEKLKENIDIDELSPIAYAHFQIARIYYKFVTPDKKLQHKNLTYCLEYYQKFVSLCEKHKELDTFKAEVGCSKEMISLLPLKLKRLQEDLSQ